jgi:two-component system, NtrC family, sensor kinase
VSGEERPALSALEAHVADAGEESLSQAYELGRQALSEGSGLLDVLALYEGMIRQLVLPAPPERQALVAATVADYFREFLSPFEMSFRGYQEANRDLQARSQELAAANAELREKQAQLVQSAKMASLGELVAGVAHEINNPLSFVRSHVSTTRNGLAKIGAEVGPSLSPTASELLARAQRRLHDTEAGLERIRDLVVKLRVFSRLDEGERKEVKISECVESVLTILQHKLEGRIEIVTHFGRPDLLDCYPGLLNQAIMNLVANAIDAIEGSGTISISTGGDAEGYAIMIADTGQGIAPEHRDRIFEPFFTTKPVGKGTGLGLSISYSIIERHRGALEILPRAGGGTLAIIRLPFGNEGEPPRAS